MNEAEETFAAHLDALEAFDAALGIPEVGYTFPHCPICHQVNWGHINRRPLDEHWLRCRTDGAEFTQATGRRVHRAILSMTDARQASLETTSGGTFATGDMLVRCRLLVHVNGI